MKKESKLFTKLAISKYKHHSRTINIIWNGLFVIGMLSSAAITFTEDTNHPLSLFFAKLSLICWIIMCIGILIGLILINYRYLKTSHHKPIKHKYITPIISALLFLLFTIVTIYLTTSLIHLFCLH